MTRPAEALEDPSGRILVADDDHVTQLFIQRMLEHAGYQPDLVANGQEAISALESRQYDLVVMDCNMPLMDGFEATRHIRNATSGRFDTGIPVIALTGSASETGQLRCLDAGMDTCVSKPADAQTLIGAIEQCLGRSAREKPVSQQRRLRDKQFWEDGFLDTLVTNFATELPQSIAALQLAGRQGDLPGLKNLAHRLRGPAGVLGFSTLSAQSKALEAAANTGDLALAARLAEELIEELNDLATVLQG